MSVPAAFLTVWLMCQADADFRRAMDLAREARWSEAAEAFEAGARRWPGDSRFEVELAGVRFRQKDNPAAERALKRALAINAGDPYALNFLSTLFLLDGNTEAALKYWNRIGAPKIEAVSTSPAPGIDPILLDRAFAFGPGLLTLDDYRTTEARLALLDAFPRWRFDFTPRADGGGAFDVRFRATPQPWPGLAALRGLPFQELRPELRNVGGTGLNVTSLLRWDSQRRRVSLNFSGPLRGNPGMRYGISLDGRNENWYVPATGSFNLRRLEVDAWAGGATGRLSWTTGPTFSTRSFRNAALQGGSVLGYRGSLDVRVLSIPEDRFRLHAGVSSRIARSFNRGSDPFTTTEGFLRADWSGGPRGELWAASANLRAGRITGNPPFDELFQAGADRDLNLLLRGHPAAPGGRLGSGVLGKRYGLVNLDASRTLVRGLVTVSLGPFLDGGRAGGWLADAGPQLTVRLPGGIAFALSYGRQIGGESHAFFARVLR